ncbi:hypothetical protein [Cryobacterium sp. M91]|uniref:hypothetical protein n=1 Tax=Cryobacterium sp. M91 TaxID=2048294 RepID=UPI000CE33171|nr:hypothetical protein [Cryobacterium sp. M91]
MVYEISIHAQDPSVGRVGVVLEALADASERAGAYEYVDVAVAYASGEGVRLLDERLSSEIWTAARKRFLVSFDFGFTQPKALARLSALNNAEVRIPNGRAVLASPTLRPPSAFHAKAFIFLGEELTKGWHRPCALTVGSANLTASALSTGAEVVAQQIWIGAPSTPEWHHMLLAKPVQDWFEDTWETADPLSDVLDEYRSRHRSLPKPRQPPEERTPATRRYLASPAKHETSGPLAVQLAAAKVLWVDASSIIRNFGPNRPGSQLNTRRGTRVFFGFDAEKVPHNTTLGKVDMRVAGHGFAERTIRFGDNGMDVINLPIAEQNGVDTYLGTFLVFTREPLGNDGRGRFTLTITNAAGVDSLEASAANSVELSMHGGRRYGLLF